MDGYFGEVQTHSVEVDCHLVLPSYLRDLCEVVDLRLRMFRLQLAYRERVIRPQQSVHLIGHLKLLLAGYFPEDGVFGVWVDGSIRVRLMIGWLALRDRRMRGCEVVAYIYCLHSLIR